MTTNRNSKEFRALQAEWNKKLEKSGFNDIETPDLRDKFRHERRLHHWDSLYFFMNSDPLSFEMRHKYFVQAEHFLNRYQFEAPTDKIIWHLHSEGHSVREIVAALEKLQIKKYKKTKVHDIIRRLQKLMFKY